MKKICSFFLLILIGYAAFSQKYVPVIEQGTLITYKVASRATGQTANITLTMLNLTDTIKIKWEIPFVGTGSFQITPKGVQSGTKLLIQEPQPDEITKLNDDETLMFLSKDTFSSLVNNKTFTLNGYIFNVKTDTSTFSISNQAADVFYAVSVKGNREIWILNNPGLPIICRSNRAARGIDFELQSVTNN